MLIYAILGVFFIQSAFRHLLTPRLLWCNMKKNEHIPTLIQLMYGQGAERALAGASAQLLRWSAAFDGWLVERKDKYSRRTWRGSIHSWAEMLDFSGKAPGEIAGADICRYRDWMKGRGYADSTICDRFVHLNSFYKYCEQHLAGGENSVDGATFNPTIGVGAPKKLLFGKALALTVEEAQSLLAAMRSDDSLLGKRDYAFFLARLLMGPPLDYLLKLKYGQLERGEGGAWVRWERGPVSEQPLPEPVARAIDDYLNASGRAGVIGAEEYIFAPLVDGLFFEPTGRADDWAGDRAMRAATMLVYLKRSGRLAGIPQKKLRLTTLRHTAALLRLEAGDDIEQINQFLCQPKKKDTTTYLSRLTAGASGSEDGEAGGEGSATGAGPPLVIRTPGRTQMKHGMYLREQPPDELAAIMAEGIQGLDEELDGLRLLHDRALALSDRAGSHRQAASLADLVGRLGLRIGELVLAASTLAAADGEESLWLAEVEAMLRRYAESEGLQYEDPQAGVDQAEAALMTRVIASTRLALRRTRRYAAAAVEVEDVIRYTDLYCTGCGRLVRLLNKEARLGSDTAAEIQADIDQAIADVTRELALSL